MAFLTPRHLSKLVETNNGSKSSRLPHRPYSSDAAAFDTNMVIILAALLCALILALGLNSIMRCAMRCISFNSSSTNSVRMASSPGLKKNALRRIPVAVYHPDLHIPATDCPICLAEFSDGDRVRVLPRCQHGFHVTCIDMWLLAHSSCPTCRQSLLDHHLQLVSSDAVAGGFHGGETTIIVDEVS